jgi:hypothetical protein
MYIYTIQCTHYIPCLILLTSYTLITCNNYITTRIINQRLFCNKCMGLSNTYDHAMCIHFHHLIYMTFQLICNYYAIVFQFEIKNLKIWNLGEKPLSKWHMVVYQHIYQMHQQPSCAYAYGLFVFALGGWRVLFLFLERLKAFVFTLGGWRVLFCS